MPAYMCSTKYLHINIKRCGRQLCYANNQDSSREISTQAKLRAALREESFEIQTLTRDLNDTETEA